MSNLIIPKEAFNKFGYDKKLGKGKWFNIHGFDFKLAFMKESKTFATRLPEITKLSNKMTSTVIAEQDEKQGVETTENYCKLLMGSVILDWKIKAKEGNKEVPVKLNFKDLATIFIGYPEVLTETLSIFQDNKKFQNIDTKKP